jgi:hypothetical protein
MKKPAWRRALKIRYLQGLFGGAEEDRTPDLRIANATLSQLSYRPEDPNTSRGNALAAKF